VEADAAFVRAAGIVVLHAESLENAQRAIIHPNWNPERILAGGPAQHLGNARVEEVGCCERAQPAHNTPHPIIGKIQLRKNISGHPRSGARFIFFHMAQTSIIQFSYLRCCAA
jgi:hypothetical protein